MRDWRGLVLALCGGAAACGGGGAGTPGGDGTEGTATAACVSKKLTLAGDLEGQPVDVQLDVSSSLSQQLNMPFSTDLTYAGGAFHLQWNTMVRVDGPAVAATGTVVMPTGGPHAGETICAGKGTLKGTDPAGTGFDLNRIFTLGTLSSGPTCPGAALDGSIKGCVGE